MAAPPNNNFANAILLGTNFGKVYGTNIEATAEAGEPANNGKTVWYRYVPNFFNNAFTNHLFFSTRFAAAPAGVPTDPDGAITKPLRTVMRIYAAPATPGVTFADLTEVTYTPMGTWKSNYAGWENGSYLAFITHTGTAYYIRIDGYKGPTDAAAQEGNFILSWGDFFNLSLGACNDCPPLFSAVNESVCKGVVSLPSSKRPSTTPYGTFPKGLYVARYCGGAIQWDSAASDWSVEDIDPGEGETDHYLFHYIKSDNTGGIALLQGVAPDSPYQYVSQADAENQNRCIRAIIPHNGGPISLEWRAEDYGNLDGNPLPTFGLYLINPMLSVKSACAAWVVTNTSATCTFKIQNNNSIDWTGLTATLSASGGITAPSASVTNLNIAANGSTTDATFTFNASTRNVTALLTISGPYFPSPIVLQVFLGPLLKFTNPVITGGGFCPTPSKTWNISSVITNIGYWGIAANELTVTISASNGILIVNESSCARVASINKLIPVGLACVSGTYQMQQTIQPLTQPTNTTITFACNLQLGSFSFPLAVPDRP